MAVRLRLMRIGKRNRPAYRVCAIDAARQRGGKYLESIGFYDPYVADDRNKVRINRQRAEYWLSVGAQPSETVRSFFRKERIAGLTRLKKKPHQRPKPSAATLKKKAAARAEAKARTKAKAQARKARAKAKKAQAEKKE